MGHVCWWGRVDRWTPTPKLEQGGVSAAQHTRVTMCLSPDQLSWAGLVLCYLKLHELISQIAPKTNRIGRRVRNKNLAIIWWFWVIAPYLMRKSLRSFIFALSLNRTFLIKLTQFGENPEKIPQTDFPPPVISSWESCVVLSLLSSSSHPRKPRSQNMGHVFLFPDSFNHTAVGVCHSSQLSLGTTAH